MTSGRDRRSREDQGPVSLRSTFQVMLASTLAAIAVGGGAWMAWSERHDLAVVVLLGVTAAALSALCIRIANCRVWTSGSTLHVRNTVRSYRLDAGEIVRFEVGRTRDGEWLGAEGPLAVLDDGRSILLQGAVRPYPTWFPSGTSGEHDRIKQLAEWHGRYRWKLQ